MSDLVLSFVLMWLICLIPIFRGCNIIVFCGHFLFLFCQIKYAGIAVAMCEPEHDVDVLLLITVHSILKSFLKYW